jgi:hypothetical protein
MGSAHEEFTRKLIQAAKKGEDLLSVLEAERAHLAECPLCRAGIARLVQETTGFQAQDLLEAIQMNQDESLPEPPRYPAPDFSFRGKRVLAGLDVSELFFELKIPRIQMPLFLQSSNVLASIALPAPAPNRPSVSAQQEWTLPGGAQAHVQVQAGSEGLATLAVTLPDAPVQGCTLTLAGKNRRETADFTTSPSAVFANLLPGDYDLVLSELPGSAAPGGQSVGLKLHLSVVFYLETKSQAGDASASQIQE